MTRCHRCQTVIAAFFFCFVIALCRKWRQTLMTAQNIEHIPTELVVVKEAMDIGAKPLRRCELLGVISLLSPG